MSDVMKSKPCSDTLSEQVYHKIKQDIFAFKRMPGTRFSEAEIAAEHQVSRTPIRQALYRLQQEGYVEVAFRRGWTVSALDLNFYDELYELRMLIERAAIEKLCQSAQPVGAELEQLRQIWQVVPAQYVHDLTVLAELDEQFHQRLVQASGNQQMVKFHAELSEKIRLLRRLDFSNSQRVVATYQQHQAILQLIAQQQTQAAIEQMQLHIQHSRDEVKSITLAMLNTVQHAQV